MDKQVTSTPTPLEIGGVWLPVFTVPPPVFNRLKPPWSICQKVVNTGQYKSEWWIEFFKWPFWWSIGVTFYILKKI